MTIVLISISAALALCVLALLAVLAARGRRARGILDGRVAALVTTLDLDEVLSGTLEAAAAAARADAALLALSSDDGKPIAVAVGLSAEAAERQASRSLPEDEQARAVALSYRYPEGADAPDAVRSRLTVPLVLEDEGRLGELTVFTRTSGHGFGERSIRRLEELAARAAPAIDNARRFREARQLADHDALTGLHNRRYFHETLAREVARAHRYGRHLALIVFDLDDFKDVNDRIGHLAGDAVLADLAERVLEVVRSADVACRVGGDEFAVILPESALADAEQLHARIEEAVAARPLGQGATILLSAGVTELRPDDDALAFFRRADDALYRAKAHGKGRAVAVDGDGTAA